MLITAFLLNVEGICHTLHLHPHELGIFYIMSFASQGGSLFLSLLWLEFPRATQTLPI
jgi:hypothetical protein